jgi:hypothetical protein
MRRVPSQLEITRLLALLQADDIAPGWLRPLMWRCGWMMPPPLFLPISTDGMVAVAVTVLGYFVLGVWQTIWLQFSLALIIVSLAGLFLMATKWHRQLVPIYVIGVSILILVFWSLIWLRPDSWPNLAKMQHDVGISGWLLLFFLLLHAGLHFYRHLKRRLPSWRDYVADALAERQF